MDDTLENAPRMRMAGRFSRRVRAHAKAHRIPIVDCAVGERKHDLAEQYLAKTTVTRGVFLILVSRAPAPVWDVSPNHHIEPKKSMPYVNHYSFHILDPDWGAPILSTTLDDPQRVRGRPGWQYAKGETIDSQQRLVLDMDGTEIPVYGQQENSAYNGHFEPTGYHPLLLLNHEGGDCLAAKLRPGNVHSAEDWEDLLLPEIEREQKLQASGLSGRPQPDRAPRKRSARR